MNYVRLKSGLVFKTSEKITFNEYYQFTGNGWIYYGINQYGDIGVQRRVNNFSFNFSELEATWEEE